MILYELPYCSSKLQKLLKPLGKTFSEDGKVISGGVVPFLFYLIFGQFDIIHFLVLRHYMILVLPLKFILHAKFILTLHDTLTFRIHQKSKEYYLKRIFIIAADTLFIYSISDYHLLNEFTSSEKIKIIKNGVDLNKYYPGLSQSTGMLLTFAGGLSSETKGLDFLENSLMNSGDKFKLIICGENKRNLKHRNYAGELSETDFIQLLKDSFVVIITSRYESFSITALEAMASGIPVILTKSTGVSAYLKDQIDCLKITYSDTQGLIDKLKLLEDKEFYSTIRLNALNTVKSFQWANIVYEYERLYRNL